LIGYRVSNTVNVTIRDLNKVGDVIDSVAVAGGNFTRIDGVNFSVEDPTPFKNLARDEAFAQAKAKAEQLASLSGMSLGKATYVSENSYYASPIRMSMDSFAASDEGGGMSTPISPGEQEIRVDLQVAFEFE
ncbi:MAG: SIMPL domain-containing protein, partial [Planctomycetes bacterium]|nr:SIMPL domain-containing protein [Planctomycetota bacterium]